MPRLGLDEARRRFAAARVARMATVSPDGRPHLVPIVFATAGDRVVAVVDAKPKESLRLQRLRNIAANAAVSLLVDRYDEDWDAIWWVRGDGVASVVETGAERERAIELLRAKYPQEAGTTEAFGAAVVVTVERWVGWTAQQ
jgi:PPOX class probable F420-dependent enzyme